MEQVAERVVVGMDPHKRSVTIEVMTADEDVLGGGRFGTDPAGYKSMLEYLRRWPERVWAIEGCNGIGRHVAPCGCWLTDRTWSTSHRNSQPAPGSSPPGRAARPTPPMPTPWRWSGPG